MHRLLLLTLGGAPGTAARYGLNAFLPELDKMMGDGLITLEKVHVITYRAGARSD